MTATTPPTMIPNLPLLSFFMTSFQRLLHERGSDWVSREFGENRCRNRAIS
jgi:hypothetical protein